MANALRQATRLSRKSTTPIPVGTSTQDLQVGQMAPDAPILDDQNRTVRLSDFRGKKIVLYFYPKDDTPGCTKEACAFRDGLKQLQAKGAVVIGVSADSIQSHQAFKAKYRLPFPLLVDSDKRLAQSCGVWKQRSLYGRIFMGIERTTFVIDETGKIAHIFHRVKVDDHVSHVLAVL